MRPSDITRRQATRVLGAAAAAALLPMSMNAAERADEMQKRAIPSSGLRTTTVTCAIPATGNVHHLGDNMAVGIGRLPDEKTRQRMIEFVSGL
jgi:hypothetical protein